MSDTLKDNLISCADADRLIAAHDADVALLYLFRLRTGSCDNELAARTLCRTLREIEAAEEKLLRMGLGAQCPVSLRQSPLSPVHEPEELMGQYKSEDVTRRCRDDEVFRSILNEARKVMGKNLSSVDMKALFGVYDYLGLPSDVLMLLINYCGRLYDEKCFSGSQSVGYIFSKNEVHANGICTFLCTFCRQKYADICQYLQKYVL